MARFEQGRKDREKFKHATSRGIPGTERDDSKFEPLHFNTAGGKYKPSFDEFQHQKPSQYSSKLSESKSSDHLHNAKKFMRKKHN